MLQAIMPDSVVSSGPSKGMVRVKRSMQIAVPRLSTKPESRFSDETVELLSRLSLTGSAIHSWETDAEVDDDDDAHLDVPCAHMFAIGDAADAFGAINAGHTAYYQGEIAARNIIKLIIASERKGDAGKEVSSDFELGRYVPGQPAIKISLGLTQSLYQVDGVVGKKMDAAEDLDAPLMWKFCGIEADEDGMFL
ncbi:hypothetical protein EW026_g1989 [Hermanssonia centrifuga]|uniref:FAD/NAD(P)-binding domain-containing protein n=1 Tax=Hermanssonia centrifuga TaxID=98765 RepID=A0A4S4KQC6_9APHY|nr:hypothetical protein EW026_g1989 [Hermanssonia centrifuga]